MRKFLFLLILPLFLVGLAGCNDAPKNPTDTNLDDTKETGTATDSTSSDSTIESDSTETESKGESGEFGSKLPGDIETNIPWEA